MVCPSLRRRDHVIHCEILGRKVVTAPVAAAFLLAVERVLAGPVRRELAHVRALRDGGLRRRAPARWERKHQPDPLRPLPAGRSSGIRIIRVLRSTAFDWGRQRGKRRARLPDARAPGKNGGERPRLAGAPSPAERLIPGIAAVCPRPACGCWRPGRPGCGYARPTVGSRDIHHAPRSAFPPGMRTWNLPKGARRTVV